MKKLYAIRMLGLAMFFASGCALGMEEDVAGENVAEVVTLPQKMDIPNLISDLEQARDRLKKAVEEIPQERPYFKVRLEAAQARGSADDILIQLKEGNIKEEEKVKTLEDEVLKAKKAAEEAEKAAHLVAIGKFPIADARHQEKAVGKELGYGKFNAYKANVGAGALVAGAAFYFGPRIAKWTQKQVAKYPATFAYFNKRNLAVIATVLGAGGAYKYAKRKPDEGYFD